MHLSPQLFIDLQKLLDCPGAAPEILTPCNDNESKQLDYNKSRQVFNRRFDFTPSVIVKVRSTEQVALLVQIATEYNVPFTVRSGGHDHEGESVATGKVLIDFSLMNNVQLEDKNYPISGQSSVKQLTIQPGARFKKIKGYTDSLAGC